MRLQQQFCHGFQRFLPFHYVFSAFFNVLGLKFAKDVEFGMENFTSKKATVAHLGLDFQTRNFGTFTFKKATVAISADSAVNSSTGKEEV